MAPDSSGCVGAPGSLRDAPLRRILRSLLDGRRPRRRLDLDLLAAGRRQLAPRRARGVLRLAERALQRAASLAERALELRLLAPRQLAELALRASFDLLEPALRPIAIHRFLQVRGW